jgi:hypothetical protein
MIRGVRRSQILLCVLLPLLAPTGGCALFGGSPDAANIKLRKENQALKTQVEDLKRQSEANAALARSLQQSRPVLPALPSERLENLFTTRGLKFGRLTGGADLDRSRPGHEGIRVYVVPTDQTGEVLKAAGSFTVEAFDLAKPNAPLVGTWKFDLEEARKSWSGFLMDYNYVLVAPWQERVPEHPELTLKVTFFDELLQLPFSAQTKVNVNLPPKGTSTTRPGTRPS